jgi:hypothetical protein
MIALVGIYGRDRFTAAKQIVSLADGPLAQRENQIRALVRRFDQIFKAEELPATQEFWVRQGVGMRVMQFYNFWKWSGLAWPHDIKSATDSETELQKLATTSNGAVDAAVRKHFIDLDKSIAASNFETGRR